MICAVWQGLKVPVFQNVDGAGVVHRIYFLFSEWYINGLPNTHLLGSDLLSRKSMVIQFLRNVGQTFETMCIDSFSSILPQDMFVCFSFSSWPTYIAPVVQKENTLVVDVHVYATLYPTQCLENSYFQFCQRTNIHSSSLANKPNQSCIHVNTCQLFLSQMHEIFISKNVPMTSKDLWWFFKDFQTSKDVLVTFEHSQIKLSNLACCDAVRIQSHH